MARWTSKLPTEKERRFGYESRLLSHPWMRPEKPSSARLNWPILIEILEPGATPTNLSEPSDGTLQSSLAATAALGITPYGMFLAGILGTCMLLCIPAFGV